MPKLKLTQAAVEKLKAPMAGRVEFWDTQLPGFGLRVSDRGRKTWIALYRVGRKLVRETIGTVALIPNVGEARELARQSMQKAQAGRNPVVERREREQAEMCAAEKLPNNFKAVADRYIERYAKKNTKPTTWMELRRQLEVDLFPKWAHLPMTSAAAVIGEVAGGPAGQVSCRGPFGVQRVIDMLNGEQLPRIC